MTDDNDDKTDEVREKLADDDTVGGSTDSDSGAVLTLDSVSSSGSKRGSSEVPSDRDSDTEEDDNE